MMTEATAEAKRRHESNKDSRKYRRYQADPAAYAADVLATQWWSKQIEIAASVRDNRRTAVYAGHAVGKTHLMGGIVQWHFDCFNPSITLTTAPSWESIHDLLWGEIKNQRHGQPGRLLDMKLDGGPMHYAKGHNAERGEGFQGRHEGRVLLVLDEAMGIPIYIYEAANSMMAAPDCREILLGNPTEAAGPYFDAMQDPAWNVITISCLEHPNIAAELRGEPPPFPKAVSLTWVREMISKHAMLTTQPTADSFEFPPGSGEWYNPNDIFRSRVLGLFPKQPTTAIWSDAWLDVARTNLIAPRASDDVQMGVDVARFGDDLSVFYGGRGLVPTQRQQYAKQSITETVGRAATMADALAAEHGVEPGNVLIKVDDSGVGGGVTDGLREKGYMALALNAGMRADHPEDYYNLRAELWFNAANLAEARKLCLAYLPPEVVRKLSAELRACRYKMQSDKTRRVEAKDEYKKRVGRSPDDADAFNLFCYPVHSAAPGTAAKASPTAPSRFTRRDQASVVGSRWRK